MKKQRLPRGWTEKDIRNLADQHDRWPTFSDVIRTIMHHAVGRWVLFALWLWLGWHFFVRGWRFFLRA